MKAKKIVYYWLFTVERKDKRFEDIKRYAVDYDNKSDAAKSAKQYGKIVSSITIYEKDRFDFKDYD